LAGKCNQATGVDNCLARLGQWNDAEGFPTGLIDDRSACHFDLITCFGLDVRADDCAKTQLIEFCRKIRAKCRAMTTNSVLSGRKRPVRGRTAAEVPAATMMLPEWNLPSSGGH
jgi:hypothetical protein